MGHPEKSQRRVNYVEFKITKWNVASLFAYFLVFVWFFLKLLSFTFCALLHCYGSVVLCSSFFIAKCTLKDFYEDVKRSKNRPYQLSSSIVWNDIIQQSSINLFFWVCLGKPPSTTTSYTVIVQKSAQVSVIWVVDKASSP